MRLHVPKQTRPGETRTPITPSAVKKLGKLGIDVVVQAGAGTGSYIDDEAYTQAGASVVEALDWGEADIVATLEPPTDEQAGAMKQDAVLIGMLEPLNPDGLFGVLKDHGVTAFSLELLPRISRAQSMDVLSSQANLAGYKAVMLAADHCPKMFPMMITAAGTIAPAKAFVIGAGVAGLQAIATAKRLGAVVEAFDVRSVTKEQVQSLGARFVELPTAAQDDASTGGYAREQTEEERRKQSALMSKHVIGADVVITTAAVPGKAPPMLIPADTAHQMAPGSVIVDLGASPEHGHGNCELTRPGEVHQTDHGVTLVGLTNLPALMPVNASQVYANNLLAFLGEIVADGQLKLDLEDEVQKGCVVTHRGAIVNDKIREAVESRA